VPGWRPDGPPNDYYIVSDGDRLRTGIEEQFVP